jgi:16S rRNA (uracil1498-N3)-methyltransferase
MLRFFSNNFKLTKDDEHHLLNVMRAKIGDEIELVDDSRVFLTKIVGVNPLKFEVISENHFNPELSNKITLFYCLVKGEKLDLVIQKAVELGVSEIVLLTSSRTVVKVVKKDLSKKLERLNNIVKSAAMQSKRNVIPSLNRIIDIKDIRESDLKDHNYIAYELEAGKTIDFVNDVKSIKKDEAVSVLVGPEGGFSIEEVKKMNSIGFKNVSLGSRILRSETAAIAVLSVLSILLEAK